MNRLRAIALVQAYVVLGHLLFLALSVLALQYWRERVIQLDSACQVFKWIQYDGLQVEAHRYTAILPQLLVKLLTCFDASLPTLLKAASLAHVFVPWIIYAVIAHLLRRPWIAVASAVAAVLCTRLAFYGPVLEVNYLLCYPFLFAALLDVRANGNTTLWLKVATVISLLVVLIVHPVGAIVALFVLGIFIVRVQQRRFLYVLVTVTLLWMITGRWIFPPTGYEQGLYTALGEGRRALGDGARQPALEFLTGHTWTYTTHYMAFWTLFVALLVVLVRKGSWAMLALVSLGVLGFIMLNVLAYHAGETAMMMEKNFLPLAVMVALPLALEMRTWNVRTVRWCWIPFALVVFQQFRGISFASREVRSRYALLEQLVDQARDEGATTSVIDSRALDARGLHIHWALCYETVLLSSLDGPQGTLVVRAVEVPATPNLVLADMPSRSHSIPVRELDPRWFGMLEGTERLLSVRPREGQSE